ncbi:putative late blight resistance protein homolog r1a-6 [Phtheirospermum japonicum]|uniref:Putative late blight resistance protein homolog r1a-6 n=1 Tax=Phtheirospermum japonicum TaxID=374723 RepID=A0A830DJN5_9LAMI|nr:putative late blight resistance protein homolog r1a-6 [Phtheirospermum japonicum]
MASTAVISLVQTIDRLQNSPHIPIVLNSSSEIIKSAYNEVLSLKNVLLLFDRNISVKSVFSIARTDVNALEVFESYLSNHFPTEHQIIQFADKQLLPLQEFLQDNANNNIVLDGQLIIEAVNKLESVGENISSIFRKSLDFSENMDEWIDYFTGMVREIKRYRKDLPEVEDDIYNQFGEIHRVLTEFITTADRVFEEILKRVDRTRSRSRRERLSALDGQIREATCELEDKLEARFSNQIFLQSDQSHPFSFSLDLQEVNNDIESFIHVTRKLKEEYINELFNLSDENDDNRDVGDVTSRIDYGEVKTKMVGFSDEFRKISFQLFYGKSRRKVLSLCGMAGIGKTILAKNIFEDQSISYWFDHRVWVAVGPKYHLREILLCILAQVYPSTDKMLLTEGDQEKLAECLFKSLKGKRYLIVLDDVWDKQLISSLERLLPYERNGNRVLVTTRIGRVAGWFRHNVRFLNEEESWDLLREKVFGEDSCPPRLEKAGKRIAEKCEGLPLTIVTVADLLSKAERTPDYWNEIILNKKLIFMGAYDRIMNVLLPSYNDLPQHLKACFLYMGVFPQNYEITRSELIKLWSAEGFLDQHASFTDLDNIIDHLVDGCLLIVRRRSSTFKVKTCSLHSSFWHLCRRKAWENKFSHVINCYEDGLADGIKSQRRLCIHNNILFGIKDVYNSMASISTARSLLCSGPPHLYPVPICFKLKLLRVLDALSICSYDFPMEALKLVHLKYFALTYNGKLPRSISKLWNLQFLIVRRHLRIKHNGSHTNLPIEIWDMKELKHLQVMGSDLPYPCDDTLLPNLIALLDVSPRSCTKGVLEKLPNLEKLGIRIEVAPFGHEPLSCFDHISHLSRLESLKCVIVNPVLWCDVVVPPPPLSIFPLGLRKLTLSGLGYPWEELSKIGLLPKLEVLKLRCCAFRGPKWETSYKRFLELRFLLIEDCDLVHWKVTSGSFYRIWRLSLKNCYKLEEIPLEFVGNLREIEVVDCGRLAMACANHIEEDRSKIPKWNLDANIRSSYMG